MNVIYFLFYVIWIWAESEKIMTPTILSYNKSSQGLVICLGNLHTFSWNITAITESSSLVKSDDRANWIHPACFAEKRISISWPFRGKYLNLNGLLIFHSFTKIVYSGLFLVNRAVSSGAKQQKETEVGQTEQMEQERNRPVDRSGKRIARTSVLLTLSC